MTILKKPSFIDYMEQRVYRKNQNLMILTVGNTGSGKSYSNLRLAEKYYDKVGKGLYPIENVCFTAEEFMNRINSGLLKRGDVLIFEEVGIAQSSRNWYSVVNKMLGFLLQSFRNMNLIVLMNTPDTSFVDSQTRRLVHFVFETIGIDQNKKLVKIKPLQIQVNKRSGKIYMKYLRVVYQGDVMPLTKISLDLPSQELREQYEAKKRIYTQDLNKQILAEIKAQNKPKESNLLKCKLCGYRWVRKSDNLPLKCPNCQSKRWSIGHFAKENEVLAENDTT